MDVVIELARLGKLGKLLGAGGQARVYTLPKLSLPDAPGALVYKQYKDGHAPPHGLRALVAVRNRLELPAREKLDGLAAWPLRVVEHDGVVNGVVLTLIPDSFFQSRVLPSRKKVKDPREIQNLFVDAARTRFVGMPYPTPEQRLQLCRDLAAAVHVVHRNDLVFGDLNARNALFRLTGRPSVMLVDCDAVRIKGSMAVVPQLNAPDWDPPEGRKVLTQATDRYKFGLFVLRCLTPGPQASTSRDPSRADGALDAEGRRLLRSALSDRPADRPTTQDWGHYLEWRVSGRRIGGARQAALPAAPTEPAAAPAHPAAAPPGWRRDASGVWQPVTDPAGSGTPAPPAVTVQPQPPAQPPASKPGTASTTGWRRDATGKWQPAS